MAAILRRVVPRRLGGVTRNEDSPLGGRVAAQLSEGTSDPLLAAIGARLPGLRLLTDPLDREAYRVDETPYLRGAGLPRAIAFPTTTADVSELVGIATELRVPVVIGWETEKRVRESNIMAASKIS